MMANVLCRHYCRYDDTVADLGRGLGGRAVWATPPSKRISTAGEYVKGKVNVKVNVNLYSASS